MTGISGWTCTFYLSVFLLALAPSPLICQYWREARDRGWRWTSRDSRDMYVRGANTLITASGISLAVVASSVVRSGTEASGLLAISAKLAVLALLFCVGFSLVLIMALLRGFERAQSRNIERQRKAGRPVVAGEGQLSSKELRLILFSGHLALSSFLVGLAFLGRIAWHF